MSKISRRDFLKKLRDLSGVGVGVVVASKLPKSPNVPEDIAEEVLPSLLHANRGAASASFVTIMSVHDEFLDIMETMGSRRFDQLSKKRQRWIESRYLELLGHPEIRDTYGIRFIGE